MISKEQVEFVKFNKDQIIALVNLWIEEMKEKIFDKRITEKTEVRIRAVSELKDFILFLEEVSRDKKENEDTGI